MLTESRYRGEAERSLATATGMRTTLSGRYPKNDRLFKEIESLAVRWPRHFRSLETLPLIDWPICGSGQFASQPFSSKERRDESRGQKRYA